MRPSSYSSEMASARISCSDMSLKFLAMLSLYAQRKHSCGVGRTLMCRYLDLVLSRGWSNAAHERDGAGLIGRRQLRGRAGDQFAILKDFDRKPRQAGIRHRIDHQKKRNIGLSGIHSIE